MGDCLEDRPAAPDPALASTGPQHLDDPPPLVPDIDDEWLCWLLPDASTNVEEQYVPLLSSVRDEIDKLAETEPLYSRSSPTLTISTQNAFMRDEERGWDPRDSTVLTSPLSPPLDSAVGGFARRQTELPIMVSEMYLRSTTLEGIADSEDGTIERAQPQSPSRVNLIHIVSSP